MDVLIWISLGIILVCDLATWWRVRQDKREVEAIRDQLLRILSHKRD